MSLSSPGIGSNLDVNSIVSQLMAAEAQPLTQLAKKEAAFHSKLTALGTLKGALSSFQGAVSSLGSIDKFQAMNASSTAQDVARASASKDAAPGSYAIQVGRLAQAQTIVSSGRASTAAAIGTGSSTTLAFQFGTIEGGSFVSSSSALSATVAANGIPANSLTINGTAIATDTSVTSAKLLAEKINLASATTGVTAAAAATDSGALGAFTTTAGTGTYSLSVGGVGIISNASAGTTAAHIDAALANDPAVLSGLSNAGITFSGTAEAGTLKFMRSDGSNIAIQESGSDVSGGFAATIGIGRTKTFTSAITLSSASAITAGGNNPGNAGLVAGTLPNTYAGATFTQDASQSGGTVTIDSSNNTLQGIRDAINKAKLGVTATIVSDGSASPYRLVITSDKTGASSSMKITVTGDPAVSSLLSYDAAGTQNMRQTSAAQNTSLSVNGVAISSPSTTVSDAIAGVSLNLAKTGAATVSVARDTASVTAAVSQFVKSYNEVSKTLETLSAYDPQTRRGAVLVGDATLRIIQNSLRQTLGMPVSNAGGALNRLADIGVTFQKDGSLALDSAKLDKAVANNFQDIADLFAVVGKTTDSLVSFKGSTAASKPGNYDIHVTSLATQGKITGSAPATLTIGQGQNDEITVTVNGTTATVKLAAGTYSIDALVSHVQSLINGHSSFSSAGIGVKVSADASNHLTITSNTYGSASNVSISGMGADDLLGTGRTSTIGQNVTGRIGGIGATGIGQDLVGPAGSAIEGLRVTVTGGAENTSRGSLRFSHGYAHQLNQLLNGYLAGDGLISERTSGINESVKDLGRQKEAMNLRLMATEKRYRAQFAALDQIISSMNKTSSFLQQQLKNISMIGRGE